MSEVKGTGDGEEHANKTGVSPGRHTEGMGDALRVRDTVSEVVTVTDSVVVRLYDADRLDVVDIDDDCAQNDVDTTKQEVTKSPWVVNGPKSHRRVQHVPVDQGP